MAELDMLDAALDMLDAALEWLLTAAVLDEAAPIFA